MSSEILDSIPLWALFLGLYAIFFLTDHIGQRLGRWRRSQFLKEMDEDSITPPNLMNTAMASLVGFLLALTFNQAASEFNKRRERLIDDANAVASTFQLARYLPEPQRSNIRRQLGEYAENWYNIEQTTLLEFGKAEKKALSDVIARSETLHQQILSEADVALQNLAPALSALFLRSLNTMIESRRTRNFGGLSMRIPPLIYATLTLLAVLAALLTGFTHGLTVSHYPIPAAIVFFAYATLLMLVLDLDRPVTGIIALGQEPMIELSNRIQAELEMLPP